MAELLCGDRIKNQHPSSFSFENMLILPFLDHFGALLATPDAEFGVTKFGESEFVVAELLWVENGGIGLKISILAL